jgi:hypothetical protein
MHGQPLSNLSDQAAHCFYMSEDTHSSSPRRKTRSAPRRRRRAHVQRVQLVDQRHHLASKPLAARGAAGPLRERRQRAPRVAGLLPQLGQPLLVALDQRPGRVARQLRLAGRAAGRQVGERRLRFVVGDEGKMGEGVSVRG